MTPIKYRPKNSEVVALQLNTENLGKILELIQKPIQTLITFSLKISGTTKAIEVWFVNQDSTIIITENDYVVFSESGYDVMSEAQFKLKYEVSAVPNYDFKPIIPLLPPNSIPPYVWPSQTTPKPYVWPSQTTPKPYVWPSQTTPKPYQPQEWTLPIVTC